MNEYLVEKIDGETAVLVKGGLTLNVPLSGLPENVREGDLLVLNKNGIYELPDGGVKNSDVEADGVRDGLFQGVTFDVTQGLD